MIERAAVTATYGGASVAVFFGLNVSEIGVLGGLVIGLAGFLVKWWYEHRRTKILERAQDRSQTRGKRS